MIKHTKSIDARFFFPIEQCLSHLNEELIFPHKSILPPLPPVQHVDTEHSTPKCDV